MINNYSVNYIKYIKNQTCQEEEVSIPLQPYVILNIFTGKGGNKRKKGKNLGIGEKRELVFKEEGQEYGQVLRMLGMNHNFTYTLLGNGRLEAFCFDGQKRMLTIRGKLKNRVWINNVLSNKCIMHYIG